VHRRDETIIRYGGCGDVYPITWAADDRQISNFCDGYGWSKNPRGAYNTCLFHISGGPRGATFVDAADYPALMLSDTNPYYYGFGMLALDGRVYQYLSALSDIKKGGRWVGSKLIYSPDNGRTWCNQDGSAPVEWPSYQSRSRTSLLFFEEPQEAFSLLSVLQMGRNYEDNRDGYVYIYATNGNVDGLANQLVMCRVPKARILDRSSYVFFAGTKSDGSAVWADDIGARGVVHAFPSGHVNKPAPNQYQCVVQSWVPSVVYNAPLNLYIMACSGIGCTSEVGDWFSKPSYLGFWIAPNPWGPWTQVHEEAEWTPAGERAARCYSPQIAPKWIAADGKSFWLVWSDHQGFHELDKLWAEMEKRGADGKRRSDDPAEMATLMRRTTPYYSFNVQRFDLTLV